MGVDLEKKRKLQETLPVERRQRLALPLGSGMGARARPERRQTTF